MRESELERDVCAWVKSVGGECIKLQAPGERGFPDRLIITPGGAAFVELKRPGGGKVSPHQVAMHKRLLRFSFYRVFVADSLEEVQRRFGY